MNDDRIENQLRAWLAAEAGSITMPAGLREAAAAVRTRPAPRWSPGWSLSLPRPVLAGVATLVVVAAGASLVLSGMLPVGRADCSRVSVEAVRAAAEAVPGYRYRMTGSELQARPIPAREDEGTRLEYGTATFAFQGAYRAPADWSIEITERKDSRSPIPPTVGYFLMTSEWDAYLMVGDRGWVRPTGADPFTPVPPDGPDLRWLSPNRLTDLLAGEPFRVSIQGDPTAHEVPLTWSIASERDGCRMVSTNERFSASTGASWTLELLVDPSTQLPTTATYRLATPEFLDDDDDGSFASAQDIRYQFTFDYSTIPDIRPPTNPQILPVTEQQARDDAADAGAGLVTDIVSSALGATEVFLAHGVDGTVLLVYEEGVRETERLFDQRDDLVVDEVVGAGGRFLVVVVHDFRVARVEIDYSIARTDSFEAQPGRLVLRPFPESKGEVVTWRAYDEDGNELVLNPRPPDI
jgi:hypothetical protein